MSKNELSELCKAAKKLDMTVEVFVHGAMCMCLSGQCLLSAFLGSRSGNRGLCAGPCRLPFTVQNGTGYDLSLKDLSLLQYIRELADMGVASFKIEGRMKRPEYVAAATAACRNALDKGAVDTNLEETLKNVFSRSGFSDGYYTDLLGKDMFGIRTKEDVLAADKAFPVLHEIYRRELQRVRINLFASITAGEPISLFISDEDGNEVTVFGAVPTSAKTKPLDKQAASKNLCKFGGTPYLIENFAINTDEGLFVSAGELNDLRRRAIEELDEKRGKIGNFTLVEGYESNLKKSVSRKNPALICRFENAGQLPDDLSGVSAIMLPLEENCELEIDKEIVKIVDIPRGIKDEDLISKRLKAFKENGFSVASCGNLAAVEIARREGFCILGDTGLNIYNSESVKTAEEIGIGGVVLSTEITLADCEFESNLKKGIIAYGNIPLMVFKNCPVKNGKTCNNCDKKGVIVDRKGIEFPIRCRMGYSEMLNSVPLWMADRKAELSALDFLVLYFTRETKERAVQVINAYKCGQAPDVKHTRGLYWRGTI